MHQTGSNAGISVTWGGSAADMWRCCLLLHLYFIDPLHGVHSPCIESSAATVLEDLIWMKGMGLMGGEITGAKPIAADKDTHPNVGFILASKYGNMAHTAV